MSKAHEHDEQPLSSAERAILAVFREIGVPAGVSVPSDTIRYRLYHIDGYLSGGESSGLQSAFLGLQVRGLIVPGADPFSAIAWELTPGGYDFVQGEF